MNESKLPEQVFINCPECGQMWDSGHSYLFPFCGKCGTRLPEPAQAPEPSRPLTLNEMMKDPEAKHDPDCLCLKPIHEDGPCNC